MCFSRRFTPLCALSVSSFVVLLTCCRVDANSSRTKKPPYHDVDMSTVVRAGCRTPPTKEQQDFMFAYMLQQQEEQQLGKDNSEQTDDKYVMEIQSALEKSCDDNKGISNKNEHFNDDSEVHAEITKVTEAEQRYGQLKTDSNSHSEVTTSTKMQSSVENWSRGERSDDEVDGYLFNCTNEKLLQEISNSKARKDKLSKKDETKENSDSSETLDDGASGWHRVAKTEQRECDQSEASKELSTKKRHEEVNFVFGDISMKNSLGFEESCAGGTVPAATACRRSFHDDSDDDQAREITELLKMGTITASEADHMSKNLEMQKGLDKVIKGTSDSDIHPYPLNRQGIPINWTHDAQSRHSFKPAKIELFPGDTEYDRIQNEMSNAGLNIVKVVRLENVELLERFKMEVEHIKRRKGSDSDLNVRYLYHGTSVNESRICEEGLDQRLSRMGFFGKGIYFSDNPLKCVNYSGALDGQTNAYLLKCRVILGDQKCYPAGQHDTSLRREPEKERVRPGDWRFYDSVLGCPKDYNEYVIYENRRAMIEYIVWFKMNEKGRVELIGKPKSPTFTKNDSTEVPVTSHEEGEEEHFERISQVREAIRKKRCEEKGISYVSPTQDKQKQDRELWIRLQKLHGVESSLAFTTAKPSNSQKSSTSSETESAVSNMGLINTEQSKIQVETSHISATHKQGENIPSFSSSTGSEPDPVDQVMSSLISDFLGVTGTEDIELAKYYIEKSQMDVNQAIVTYYEELP